MRIRPVTAVDIRLDEAWPDRALERAARAVRSLGERAPLGPACAAAISRVVALGRVSQRLMRLLGRRARFRGVPLLPRPAVVSGCLSLRLSPQSFRRIDHSFDLGCRFPGLDLHGAVIDLMHCEMEGNLPRHYLGILMLFKKRGWIGGAQDVNEAVRSHPWPPGVHVQPIFDAQLVASAAGLAKPDVSYTGEPLP